MDTPFEWHFCWIFPQPNKVFHFLCLFDNTKCDTHATRFSLPSRPMDDMKTIPWARVAVLLGRADRTQVWLAARLNIAPNVVTNWKRRGGAPVARARELADVFGVSVAELLGSEEVVDRMSKAGLRLVDRIREMDRLGLLTRQAEVATLAFLDLVERVGVPAAGRGRK